MSKDLDRRSERLPQKGGGDQLHPAAKLVLQALSLPVAGLVAAGVLFVVGAGLILVALVLIAGLLAGAASVPLAMLAGRRRITRARFVHRDVIDARATVHHADAEQDDQDESADSSGP
jgi:hypothetical protein